MNKKRAVEKLSLYIEGVLNEKAGRVSASENIRDFACIESCLSSSTPCCITRFGSTEMRAVRQYYNKWELMQQDGLRRYATLFEQYIDLRLVSWYDEMSRTNMPRYSGFFPADDESLDRYCSLVVDSLNTIDILALWLGDERKYIERIGRRRNKSTPKYIGLDSLDPVLTKLRWVKLLKDKKILVVHPFTETMERQLPLLDRIFPDWDFKNQGQFIFYKCVQSLGGSHTDYTSWFEAFEVMNEEISRLDFEVALIAGGAYGMPLGMNIKRQGKQAIHIGGCLQLLFGIKGKRWDKDPRYDRYYNEYWVRAEIAERPAVWKSIESGCYW